MPIRLLIFAITLAIFSSDGSKEGRQGNAMYKADEFREAAARYLTGLEGYADGAEAGGIYYGLQNNLGAALHRAGEFESSHLALQLAMMTAPSSFDYARAAYNDGNNAVSSEDLEAALAAYRNALLADPTNDDARFNYEFIKRQQQQQDQQGDGDDQNQESENNEDQSEEGGEQGDNEDDKSQDSPENQDQDQQQDGDEQEQQPNQPQENEQEEQQEQDSSPQEQEPQDQLSRQQAERILQALQNEEEQLLRQVQKIQGQPQRVEKDW